MRKPTKVQKIRTLFLDGTRTDEITDALSCIRLQWCNRPEPPDKQSPLFQRSLALTERFMQETGRGELAKFYNKNHVNTYRLDKKRMVTRGRVRITV